VLEKVGVAQLSQSKKGVVFRLVDLPFTTIKYTFVCSREQLRQLLDGERFSCEVQLIVEDNREDKESSERMTSKNET